MRQPTASLLIVLRTEFPAAGAGVNALGTNNPGPTLRVDD